MGTRFDKSAQCDHVLCDDFLLLSPRHECGEGEGRVSFDDEDRECLLASGLNPDIGYLSAKLVLTGGRDAIWKCNTG